MIDAFDALAGQIQTGSFFAGRDSGWFVDPFSDMASLSMPLTMDSALRWTEFILSNNGTYRAALERNIRYFLTDVEVEGEGLSRAEKVDIKDYLHDELDIMSNLEAVLMDRECYGNTFCSLLERFRRYYVCGRCHFEVAFDHMESMRAAGRSQWRDFAMHATCPKCGQASRWSMKDRRGGTDSDHVLKRWPPLEMSLTWDPYTDRVGHIWKIPEEERRGVREGVADVLREAPIELIEAVESNSYIRLGRDIVYHGKERCFAGIRNRGWGIPRPLVNFRQSWYVQVLRRFNEAIGLDYVMPFRVITPVPGNSDASDPLMNVDMQNSQGRIEGMIREHRRDPAGWHFLPFPVQYQALGGEANDLAPYQLLDQGQADLLDACNIPTELYKMSLSIQSAQPSLRLYESVHRAVPRVANQALAHVMKRLCRLKGWPAASAKLIPTTLIDDLNKQMPRVQLMASGQVSPQTGLSTLGLDAYDEARKTLEYQQFQAETQKKIQDNMTDEELQNQLTMTPLMQLQQAQQAQAAGQPQQGQAASPQQGQPAQAQPAPGAAGAFSAATPMSGNTPVEPSDILSQAQAIAMQIGSGQVSEEQKNQQLAQIKQTNPLLHLAVKDALRQQREQVRMQAGDQAMGKAGVHAIATRLGVRPGRPLPPIRDA